MAQDTGGVNDAGPWIDPLRFSAAGKELPKEVLERAKKVGPLTYTVLVDDNFHYMDESERYVYGTFETYEAAVAACKSIVDLDLRNACQPGTPADELSGYNTIWV